VLLCLLAAMMFAISTTLKHLSADATSDVANLSPRKLARFVQDTMSHRLWIAGIGCDVAGVGLQVVALHLGALAIVQPLMVSGLLFALILRQHFDHRPFGRVRLGWAVVLVGALAGFLVLASVGSPGAADAGPDRLPAVIAGCIGVVLIIGCVEVGRRQRGAGRRGSLIGIAVGTLYAAGAALLKAVTDIAVRSPLDVLQSWQLYALIAVGLIGLLLNQIAFQAGRLSASLPAIATTDPLLSIVIGVAVYDEQLNRGPAGGAVLVALLGLMGIAVIQLARSTDGDKTSRRIHRCQSAANGLDCALAPNAANPYAASIVRSNL
jgi:hypothetical protein